MELSGRRRAENFVIVDLTDAEIAELHEIDKTHHFRACNPEVRTFAYYDELD